MDNNKENKDLIERMSEILRNHSEPYKEGAWERFSAKYASKTPKKNVLWPYWSAAAGVLLAVGMFFLFYSDRENPAGRERHATYTESESAPAITHPVVPVEEERSEKDRNAEGFSVAAGETAPAHQRKQTPSIPLEREPRPNPRDKASLSALQEEVARPLGEEVLAQAGITVDEQTIKEQEITRLVQPEDSAGTEESQLANTPQERVKSPVIIERDAAGVFDGLPQHGRAAKANNDEHENTLLSGYRETKKWDLGIVVSPTVTSEKVNFGGGISLAYRFSDKFSLSSGVSMGEMGVAQQRANAGGGNDRLSSDVYDGSVQQTPYIQSSSLGSRSLTDVTSSLLTVDIPLDLKYHLNKRFYTSVGMSFLAVLNEQRTSHYVTRQYQSTVSAGFQNHLNVETAYSAEPSADQPMDGRGYAGFINFSLGHRTPVSRKMFISLEPFFKLPVGRLSREDMDLTNGGLKIIAGF